MKIGSNQREIGFCSCKQSSYFVSRKLCIKTESPSATQSVATREQWAYLVQSQNFTFQTYFFLIRNQFLPLKIDKEQNI